MKSENRQSTRDGAETPRIYVASLSDYNAGRLHGRWIDADQSADDIRAEIAAMLAGSSEPPAEEWAIHDYDNFAGYRVGEFADLDHVAEVARLITEHGPVFAGLLDHFGDDLEQARDHMAGAYRGEFDGLAEYAAQLCDDLYREALGRLPDFIRYNIDWEAIGRDLEMGGDVFTVPVGRSLHVFDAHL